MAGKKVGSLDIQFGQAYDMAKANQLVQSLQQVIGAVNTLSNQTTPDTPTTVAEHVLATESGLGPSHEVSGLQANQVLIATSPTSAEFAFLAFSQLAGVDPGTFEAAENGDVIMYVDGYWSAVPSTNGLGLANPGADAIPMWDTAAHGGTGGLVWALPGTGISLMSGSISVDAHELTHGNLLGLLADDHPQYALVIDTPLLGSPNIFTALNTFQVGLTSNSDIDLNGNLEQAGLEPEQRIDDTDDIAGEGNWRLHVEPGQWMQAAMNDDGSDAENWMYVQRIADIVDTIGFSANYLRFNGFSLVAANPVDGADFLPLIVDGITYYVVTSSEPLGGGTTTDYILPAGWNASGIAVPVALTVAQDLQIPYGSTLQEVRIQTQLAPGFSSGSCTVTLGQSAFPIVTTTDITGGTAPAISAGTSYDNTTLSGWTTVFAQGVMIRATLTANTGFSSVKIYLRFQ
jgi:hypothetical protein